MLLVAKESIEEQMSVFFFTKKKKNPTIDSLPMLSFISYIYLSFSEVHVKYCWQ